MFRTVDRVFIHAQFVKKTFNNDIALIKLNQPVSSSSTNRSVVAQPTDQK